METVLTIVGVVLVFPYIAGPLLLWMNGSRIPPTMMEPANRDAPLPTNAESHLWKTTHFFASNGFETLGDRVRESARNGFSSYKQVWRNGETGEIALAGAFLKEDDASFCNTFVAFLHDRGNGAMVMTSNFNAGARTLLDPPGSSKISVANQDLNELRALHQGHIAAIGGGTVRPLRVRDGFALCKQLDDATRTMAVSTKRFRAEGDTLRITLWGAIYGIWLNLPPLKWQYEREERQLVEKALAAGTHSGAVRTTPRAA